MDDRFNYSCGYIELYACFVLSNRMKGMTMRRNGLGCIYDSGIVYLFVFVLAWLNEY